VRDPAHPRVSVHPNIQATGASARGLTYTDVIAFDRHFAEYGRFALL
jgi:hypothetical protein